MRRIIDALRSDPPASLLGRPLESVEDDPVLVLRAQGVRVVVRPSGTEPKLKCYLEVVAEERAEAAAQVAALRAELARTIGA
jgi:phosphomannomutase